MPDPDILHAIINGSAEFNQQYKDLMHGLTGESGAELEPIDINNPSVTGGVHQTLKAILGHLERQQQVQPKTVQVIRDQGGRLVGAKVIPEA